MQCVCVSVCSCVCPRGADEAFSEKPDTERLTLQRASVALHERIQSYPPFSSSSSYLLHPFNVTFSTSVFPLFSPILSHFARARTPPPHTRAQANPTGSIFSLRWGFEGRMDSTPRLTPAPVLTRTPLVRTVAGQPAVFAPKL